MEDSWSRGTGASEHHGKRQTREWRTDGVGELEWTSWRKTDRRVEDSWSRGTGVDITEKDGRESGGRME